MEVVSGGGGVLAQISREVISAAGGQGCTVGPSFFVLRTTETG